ncbi:MAG: SWIM zinc finger family protein [Flavobacteriales bacterium]|nr:SWIM zinc finger family protein [Flavobacteriales bacterium]
MSETLTYQYAQPSNLEKSPDQSSLFLSKYSEVIKEEAPCFFWGKMTQPFELSKCLITLSNVVQSSFSMSPFQMSLLKDPIVTAGNERIRFEGFSHCAGVYGRVDVLPDGHDGEFIASGTTNVDFNRPMITALSGVQKKQNVVLSVGQKEVGIHTKGKSVIERKVPLPTKWIKGLTTVQLYQSECEFVAQLNKVQILQLFRSIPKGKIKKDFYLIKRGNQWVFSPITSRQGVTIGGVDRLHLLSNLMTLADQLKIYAHPKMQSTTWQLYFGSVCFSLSLSREPWRGYSGEGAALDKLIDDTPDDWLEAVDNFAFANQSFNPAMMSVQEGLALPKVENIAAKLSAMGLLGYDLDENQFYYRRLPFKLQRILSLNPRLKGAQKLIDQDAVHIISEQKNRVEAEVQGSGVKHIVLLDDHQERCTCTWYSRHKGDRGPCKHVLATKMKVKRN